MIRILLCFALLVSAAIAEPFRPEPGKFPPASEAKSYRGELVFVDHINRRGSLRLHVDGHFSEGPLHHFAMLPYGMIYYRGAPADLRDIPIGTILHGRFYLPPDPKKSLVPIVSKSRATQPKENYAVLLEDGPSLCLREGKSWKLKKVESDHLLVSLDRKEGGEGLGGEHKVTIDGSTRIWRGRELLNLDQLAKVDSVQLGLTWHPKYLHQKFHVADIWLDEVAMKVATERQRQIHIRNIRHRWMPAKVDAVDHGKFGKATIAATLFGGMAPSLYADFKPGIGGKMAAAESTLRTWWPDHDGMDGRIIAVSKAEGEPEYGSSGIQVQLEVPLVLEGFRPGRIVRIRPGGWPNITPPTEERIKGFNDRWPSTDVFKK